LDYWQITEQPRKPDNGGKAFLLQLLAKSQLEVAWVYNLLKALKQKTSFKARFFH